MVTSRELDSLRKKVNLAFQHKQEAFSAYKEARDYAANIYAEERYLCNSQVYAKEALRYEKDKLEYLIKVEKQKWDMYFEISITSGAYIDELVGKSQYECEMKEKYLKRANEMRQQGEEVEALSYFEKSRYHEEIQNHIDSEIKLLKKKIEKAREDAESHSSKIDYTTYNNVKEKLDRECAQYELTKRTFEEVSSERDRLQNEFKLRKTEYDNLREEQLRKIAAYKQERSWQHAPRKLAVALS